MTRIGPEPHLRVGDLTTATIDGVLMPAYVAEIVAWDGTAEIYYVAAGDIDGLEALRDTALATVGKWAGRSNRALMRSLHEDHGGNVASLVRARGVAPPGNSIRRRLKAVRTNKELAAS